MRIFLILIALFLLSNVSTAKAEVVSGKAKATSKDSNYVTLVYSGLTFHGFPNGAGAGNYMPRRLDPNGQLVVTPGLGVFYQHNSWLFEAAYLKDCYDHDAIPLLIGRQWKFNRMPNLKLALLGGVYIRQNPDFCTSEYCVEFQDMGPIPKLLLNNKRLQVFPYATVQLNYMVPISRDIDLQFSLSSMLIINQFTAGVRFRLP